MVISPFVEWKFTAPSSRASEDIEYQKKVLPIRMAGDKNNGLLMRLQAVKDLQEELLEQYEFVQLLRFSCPDIFDPMSFPLMHDTKHQVWRTVFANTTQFDPPPFTKGKNFIAYFHIDAPPSGLVYFKEKLREFNDERGFGERRLLIDPVPPESDGILNSQLNDLPMNDPLTQRLKEKEEGRFNDPKRALTRVYGTTNEIPNLRDNTSSIHTSMYFNKTIHEEAQNLPQETHAYGVQEFIMGGEHNGEYGIDEFVLESLRFIVTQFNCQELSLLGTQTGIRTRVGGQKANVLHTTMYDPLLLLKFSEHTALTLFCDVEKVDDKLDSDGIIGWPGGRNSLWHMLRRLKRNSSQEIVIRSFWEYLQHPCIRKFNGFAQQVNHLEQLVIEQAARIYRERILENSPTLGALNEWSLDDFINFLHPSDGLDDENPIVLGAKDEWNLGRLQHLKKVVELLDGVEGIQDSDPYREYAVLFWHLTKFPDFVRLMTALLKEPLSDNYQCLTYFEIRGD